MVQVEAKPWIMGKISCICSFKNNLMSVYVSLWYVAHAVYILWVRTDLLVGLVLIFKPVSCINTICMKYFFGYPALTQLNLSQ